MKKIIILSLILIPNLLYSAVEVDLRKGLDLTTTNVASFSLLNQLVDNGTIVNTGSVTNNKGIIMRSTIRPDVTLNPRMTNWLWLDLSLGSPGTLRQYVCCGDANANWQVAALGIGSVTSSNILDFTILAIDMATNSVPNYALQDNSVDANKIQAQAVVSGKIGPSAVFNLNIAPSTIEGGRIALNTISNANIYDFTIQSNKIAIGGITDFNIKSGGLTGSNVIAPFSLTGTNLQNNTVTNEQLANAAVDSNKIALATINRVNLSTNVTVGMIHAWAIVDGSGTLIKGHNIASASRFNAGDFRIAFGPGFAPSTTNYLIVGCALNSIANSTIFSVYSNELTSISYNLQNSGGSDQDQTAYMMLLNFP